YLVPESTSEPPQFSCVPERGRKRITGREESTRDRKSFRDPRSRRIECRQVNAGLATQLILHSEAPARDGHSLKRATPTQSFTMQVGDANI
ncbi:hypothetical protein BaRGS_00002306, partial [Batillaria attramentaria]